MISCLDSIIFLISFTINSLSLEYIFELNFTVNSVGWHKGKLSLQDYPISFDDDFYFSFEVKPQLNVQHIYESTSQGSLEKLFAKDSYFNYSKQNIKQINYSSLNQSQLII